MQGQRCVELCKQCHSISEPLKVGSQVWQVRHATKTPCQYTQKHSLRIIQRHTTCFASADTRVPEMQKQTLSWRQENPQQGANDGRKQAWAELQASMERCLPGKLCSDRQAQRERLEQCLLQNCKLVGYQSWHSFASDICAACRHSMYCFS